MGHSRKRKHNQQNPNESNNPEQESQTEVPEDSLLSESEIKIEKDADETNEQAGTSEQSAINRKARIIVRNLSFKTNEKKLKKHFEQYGSIDEVKLLKRPDGKLVGCGFVQFKVTQHAAKAIHHESGKPFLGREIVCDWAFNKRAYVKSLQTTVTKDDGEVITIKNEDEIKTEKLDENVEIKEEKDTDDGDVKVVEDVDESTKHASNSESDEKSEPSESENEDDDDDDIEMDDEESNVTEEPEVKRPRVISNDVQQGKTVFVKNVPFAAVNNDVHQCFEQFGPLEYALVCIDRLTEHSKGTAFVKFRSLEDAEKCLQAGTELTLMGQVLDCHKALSKDDLDKSKVKKEDNKKDSRNLYLIKEGVILAGSRAAQTVSASDMAKRLELEKWKTQILRNLNMFISKTRLIIHNLPPTYDDKQLRALFERFSSSTAVIKEAKVMRDIRNLDDEGKAISKEYGFVSYAEHEDALKALRGINNNPSIFSRTRRPIVAFSIENKAVINARNKRLMKSKLNNPKCKDFNPKAARQEVPERSEKAKKNPKFRTRDKVETDGDFAGVTAKPGKIDKMRSKYKLKVQAQIHHETLKNEKKKLKLTRKVLKKRKDDHMKQMKMKKGKGKKREKVDNVTKIINKYRKSGAPSSKVKKRKWYENS